MANFFYKPVANFFTKNIFFSKTEMFGVLKIRRFGLDFSISVWIFGLKPNRCITKIFIIDITII